MTVTASAVVAMLVIMSAAAVFAAFAMMMATTVTAARQHLDGLVDLFLGGVAVLNDGAREIERLASQRVVGVDSHTVLLDLHHLGHELMVLAICQGNDGIGEDIVVVEMAVDREYLTIDLMNTLRLVGTEDHWKIWADFSNHWKKIFQSLENFRFGCGPERLQKLCW